jgi:hypothetical protein
MEADKVPSSPSEQVFALLASAMPSLKKSVADHPTVGTGRPLGV